MTFLRHLGRASVMPNTTPWELLFWIVYFSSVVPAINSLGGWGFAGAMLTVLVSYLAMMVPVEIYKNEYWVTRSKESDEELTSSNRLAGKLDALSDRRLWTCLKCQRECGIAPGLYREASPVKE